MVMMMRQGDQVKLVATGQVVKQTEDAYKATNRCQEQDCFVHNGHEHNSHRCLTRASFLTNSVLRTTVRQSGFAAYSLSI